MSATLEIPITGRENARAKALRYLLSGRVIVTEAAPGRVRARVRGDGAVYDVRAWGGVWGCDCASTGRCSHILAVQQITATS